MADPIDMFVRDLFEGAHEIEVVVDRADDATGESFIDIVFNQQAAQVSYRPAFGFGLYSSPDTFGQRPDEIVEQPQQAAARFLTLLAEARGSDAETRKRIVGEPSPKSPAAA